MVGLFIQSFLQASSDRVNGGNRNGGNAFGGFLVCRIVNKTPNREAAASHSLVIATIPFWWKRFHGSFLTLSVSRFETPLHPESKRMA